MAVLASRLAHLAVAVGVATWTCVCGGQAAAQTWGEVDLPGGVAAARQVLGLGTDTRTASAFLVDFIRTYHQFGDADSTALERFERYLRYVQALQSALAGWPDGLQLGTDRLQGQNRDRWRTVAAVLALRLREVKNRPVLELDKDDEAVRRAGWLKSLGIDLPQLAQQLNQGERVRLVIASDALPLPLPGIWPALLDQAGRPDIVTLGATHRPALLYVGLMSLDAETLAFLAAHPKTLDVDTAEAGTFAAFGRSIRVRGGRIDVPGGAAYAPIWVQLVDRRLDEPLEFIRRLLSRDEGRLAFLYDTVAHVSPALRGALFDGAETTEGRLASLGQHYRWFKDVDPAWKVGTRPFYRPPLDPSLVLTLLDVSPVGTVGLPWWPQILEEVANDDGWPDRSIRDLQDRRANLTWALPWIFDSKAPEPRFRLLRFAQRRFATTPRTAAAPVEVALRGFSRMPALMLTLERMGVDNPMVLADVATAAMRLTTAADVAQVELALRQWQAALSILEQIARRRAIPAATRDGLLMALAKVVPPEHLPSPGAVGTWMIEQLNPALGVPAPSGTDYETAAIAAWLAPASAPTRTFTWEGLDYRIDRVGPVVRDATAVRAGVKGPTLTHLELLVRTVREIEAGVKALDRTKELASRLESVRKELLELRNDENKPLHETDDLEDAARTIARIRRERDLTRVARQLPTLRDTLDVVTAHALPGLAYALAAAPSPQPQIYGDIALRHLITASPDAPPEQWRHSAWTLPRTGPLPIGSMGILGSMLALDTTLADGQLRRLAAADASAPPVEGKFNSFDRDALTMRLLYASPLDDVESAARLAVDALAAGQARWANLASTDAATRAAMEAVLYPVLGETRANLAVWLRERNQSNAADEMLLPSERVRLGTDIPLPVALGMAASSFDGCLCLQAPPMKPIGEWLGRGDSGHLSVLVVDVQVRLVQALAELALPAYLVELVLPLALQDTIDRVGQFSPDDWEAVAVARFILKARVEEYLLALVAEGVLAPPVPAAGLQDPH